MSVRRPAAHPQNLLSHLLHGIASFILLGLSFSYSVSHVFADDLAEKQSRPNIVLVLTDDQGYGDFSLHGNPHVQTPNLDRFARSGLSSIGSSSARCGADTGQPAHRPLVATLRRVGRHA